MGMPYPPGQEIAHIGNADEAHAGNVAGVNVKAPGDEQSRYWPDGPPGMPDDAPPPVASFTAVPLPAKNVSVTLDGTGSAAGYPGAEITAWNWVFSDGTAPKSGPVVTWKAPNKAGSYAVTLTVTASDGQYGQVTQVYTF